MAERAGQLVRAIGRWSLAALMLNTILGSSILGLPSLIAARLGQLSPAGYLAAAVGAGAVMACFAEVGSQFREAGGPYLYVRAAFGRFLALQVGWLTWLSRLAAFSAVANLFVTYLAEFLPRVEAKGPRALLITTLVLILGIVNYRGVSSGTWLSNAFTLAKLLLLFSFIFSGLLVLALHPSVRVSPRVLSPSLPDWAEAFILMLYAYGGFEAALIPGGETRDPRGDAPFALLVALLGATGVFVALQYVVIHTLPAAASSAKPLADSAREFLGEGGAQLVAAGALVSIVGYLSANMLHVPRLTFAMGERGDFPGFFASVHPRFRTPHVSIVFFVALAVLFSVFGSFRWNAILAAISRVFIYASVAAALPALRRRDPSAEAFRLPGGVAISAFALAFTALLASRVHAKDLIVLGVTAAIAAANWVVARRGGGPQPAAD